MYGERAAVITSRPTSTLWHSHSLPTFLSPFVHPSPRANPQTVGFLSRNMHPHGAASPFPDHCLTFPGISACPRACSRAYCPPLSIVLTFSLYFLSASYSTSTNIFLHWWNTCNISSILKHTNYTQKMGFQNGPIKLSMKNVYTKPLLNSLTQLSCEIGWRFNKHFDDATTYLQELRRSHTSNSIF